MAVLAFGYHGVWPYAISVAHSCLEFMASGFACLAPWSLAVRHLCAHSKSAWLHILLHVHIETHELPLKKRWVGGNGHGIAFEHSQIRMTSFAMRMQVYDTNTDHTKHNISTKGNVTLPFPETMSKRQCWSLQVESLAGPLTFRHPTSTSGRTLFSLLCGLAVLHYIEKKNI